MKEQPRRRVLLLTTGGTVACRQTAQGLSPALGADAIAALLPASDGICALEPHELMQLDSTDLTTADRMAIAHAVWERRAAYDGFVIAHGTDTLAHTAALLHHVLPRIDRPVVVTGSMLPLGAPRSDAPANLVNALRVAAAGVGGVFVVMGRRIIWGNHAVKYHSAAADAFVSADAPLAGTVDADGTVRLALPLHPAGEPAFVSEIDPHVLLVRLTPDLPPSFFAALGGYPKVILEAFGAGGVPQRLEAAVRALIEGGTRVYIASQCVEGGVDLDRYAVGQRAAALGAVSLGARTTEDALAAIMCGEL